MTCTTCSHSIGYSPKGSIYDIKFSSQLKEGDAIKGEFKVHNAGDTGGHLRGLIYLEWLDKWYGAEFDLPAPCNAALIPFDPSPPETMPSKDAVIKLYAEHLEAGTWVRDEEKIVTIKLTTVVTPPIPYEYLIAAAIALSCITLAAVIAKK